MAQELRHLADEVHHMCYGDAGQWFPDMRMRGVHEKLLLMVEGLQQGHPAGGGGGAGGAVQLPAIEYGLPIAQTLPPITPPPSSARPRTPPSVTKIENARLRTRLADSKVQITAMENTFASYIRSRDLNKSRQEWLHKYGLNGRFFAYDTAVINRVWAAWSKKAWVVTRAKLCRKMTTQTVAFALVEYNVALLNKAFGLWAVTPIVWNSRKRIAATLGAWYERHQGEALECQIGLYFYLWVPHGKIYRLEKEVVDANVRVQMAIENARAAKMKLLERFGELAMAQLSRMIGANDGAIVEKTFHDWNLGVSLLKEERKRAAELAEAQERERLRRLAAAEKAFGHSTETLKRITIQSLREVVQYIRAQKAKWEQGMSGAMKRIMGDGIALQRDCVNGWAVSVREDKVLRERMDMEKARKLLDDAKARAIRMLDKSKEGNGEELVLPLFTCWRDAVMAERLKRAGKEHAMAMVLRKILNAEVATRCMCLGSWAQLKDAKKARSSDRVMWENQARARFLGLAHGTIMRLHKKLGTQHVFEAWVARSL